MIIREKINYKPIIEYFASSTDAIKRLADAIDRQQAEIDNLRDRLDNIDNDTGYISDNLLLKLRENKQKEILSQQVLNIGDNIPPKSEPVKPEWCGISAGNTCSNYKEIPTDIKLCKEVLYKTKSGHLIADVCSVIKFKHLRRWHSWQCDESLYDSDHELCKIFMQEHRMFRDAKDDKLYFESMRKYCELAEASWEDEFLDWGNTNQAKYYPYYSHMKTQDIEIHVTHWQLYSLPQFRDSVLLRRAIDKIGVEGMKLILGVM